MKKTSTLILITFILSIVSGYSQTWLPMASGLGNSTESIKAIAENPVTHEIYAGGTFSSGVIKYIAKWNGTAWEAVGTGVNGPVYALAFKNQEMYVGGAFTLAGSASVNNIAKWSSNTWSDVGGGFNDQVNCIFISASSGTIHAGGKFSLSGGNAMNHISKLVSTTWTQIGTGIGSPINAMAEYNGSLFAGSETVSGPVHKFDGTNWSTVTGLSGGKVYALASFSGYLYAGGDFSSPSFAGAKYNGTSWGTIVTTFSSTDKIYAYSPRFSTILYVSGKFTNMGVGSAASYIAKITTPTNPIQKINADTSKLYGEVYAIGNQSGKVIAGGKFTTPATNIAITSTTIGVTELSKIVVKKSFFPNPAHGETHLKVYTTERLKNAELKIFDIQSRLISNLPVDKKENTHEIEFIFNCSNITSGVYYYLVTEEGQNILSDKFVVE